MKKKALLAILLIMTLLLSSCALIVKDEEADRNTVILQLGDEKLTKSAVKSYVDYQLYYNNSLYSMYGMSYDVTDASTIASVQSSVVESLKKDMALRAKAKELGFDQLTDEETAQVNETAQTNYDTQLETIKKSLTDSGVEGEELDKQAAEKMEANGYRLENYVASAKDNLIDKKLKDYAIQDVTVSDEEVQEDYDAKVAADQETYAEDAGAWATAANKSTTLYYTPEGVRRVKQILIKFTDEDSTAVKEAGDKVTEANKKVTDAEAILNDAEATDEEKAAAEADQKAAQEELEAAQKEEETVKAAAYEHIAADADAVLADLANGSDWDTLMAEKTQDPGMQSGAATAETGYAVAAGMTNFDSAFVDAAMALANIGDVSDKVPSDLYGYYIIKYVGDEKAGAAELTDELKESLHSALLTSKQNTVYDETVTQWVDTAGIKVNLDALKD